MCVTGRHCSAYSMCTRAGRGTGWCDPSHFAPGWARASPKTSMLLVTRRGDWCKNFTITRVRVLPLPSEGGGGGVSTILWRSAPDWARASRNKKKSIRLDKISRRHITCLVLGQHLTSLGLRRINATFFKLVKIMIRGQFHQKIIADCDYFFLQNWWMRCSRTREKNCFVKK